MKLHELHVAELGPGPKCHGVAVAGGDGGIGRFSVELPCSAGRQHDRSRPDQGKSPAPIPDECTPAPSLVRQKINRRSYSARCGYSGVYGSCG